MAAERKKKRTPKTESLTIRLDPKMRFALDFVARMKGQTITKVIETAVMEKADNEFVIHETFDWNDGEVKEKRTWKDYWNVNEAVRFINLARAKETNPTFEEEFCLQFMEDHNNYFFKGGDGSPDKEKLDVLWPLMPEFLAVWEETKATDREKVKIMMDKALIKAGLMHENFGTCGEELPF
ncbi:hypothetical protein [Bombella mellum]|uniref:Uncharacterized protein n=1 Tax=Bombella mellum TaxID=2039288 RepID=A0ABR5ZRE6_9PROT|nr:hypothetical protein [Bombella mellum]MBA5726906.1 hypothetical protein [Bombella mellum]